MSQPGNVSDYKARQSSGRCVARRCPRMAEVGDYCAGCDAAQRARKRRSASKRRARLAELELCECGNRRKRGARRCRPCLRKQTTGRARVDGRQDRVDGRRGSRGHYKTEVFADGASRARYVGLDHRGGPTRAEQDASLVKLVLDAVGHSQSFLEKFPSERAVLDALPRIQRDEAWEALVSRLTRSARLQLEVAGALTKTWREACAGCGRAHEAEADG